MTVSYSVLVNKIVLHLFRACFMFFNKILLFSCTFLVKFISKYFVDFGPIVGGMFFSISSSVYYWNRKKKSLISVYLSFIQPNSLINPVLCLFKLEPLGFFLMYTIICKSREICFFFYWHTLILLLFQNNFKFIKSCKNNNNTRNIHISNR